MFNKLNMVEFMLNAQPFPFLINFLSNVIIKNGLGLHETDIIVNNGGLGSRAGAGECGSYGLAENPNNTTMPPCFILVDVNGDRKPNMILSNETKGSGVYTYPKVTDKRLNDIFNILITEDKAIPFGVVAQRAMYNK